MSRYFDQVVSLSRKPPKQLEGTGTVPDATTVSAPKPRLVQPSKTQANEVKLQSGTVPSTTTVPLPQRPRTRVFRATRVEHGHTPGERLVLQALWAKAAGDDQERTIRIGYDRLATIASVNWKTARACLRSLEQKLAIETLEPENSNSREGRLYRIYGFERILERRKRGGLEWVQKGRGIEFLETGTVPLIGAVPSSGTVPVSGTESPPDNGTEAVPATGTPLRSSKEKKEATTTPAELLQSLEALLPGMDERAVARVWEGCKQAVHNVSAEEAVYFFEQRLALVLRSKRVENPIGLMISSVGDWITTRKVQERREALVQEQGRRRKDEYEAAESMARLQAEMAWARKKS